LGFRSAEQGEFHVILALPITAVLPDQAPDDQSVIPLAVVID